MEQEHLHRRWMNDQKCNILQHFAIKHMLIFTEEELQPAGIFEAFWLFLIR